MPPFEHTKCVKAQDYRSWNAALPTSFAVVGTIVAALNPYTALIAIALWLRVLQQYLDHVLDGKLVCLGRENACALGTVVSLDPPSDDPTGSGLVDNDFGINLMLSPLQIADYAN